MKSLQHISRTVLAITLGGYFILGCQPTPCGEMDTSCSVEPDTIIPKITILGSNPINIIKGTLYTDAGATVTDNIDTEITVEKTGSVDTNIIASYTITYTSEDKAGNQAIAKRIVNVIADNSVINDNNWRYPHKNMAKTAEDNNVYVLAKGQPIEQWVQDEKLHSIRLGDVTGDGKINIVGLTAEGINIFDSAGNKQGGTISLHDNAAFLILEDIDHDDTFEMLVGSKKPTNRLDLVAYKYAQGTYKTLSRTGGYDFERMRPIAYLGDNRLVVQYSSEFSGEPRGYSLWDLNTAKELWYYDIGPIINGDVSVADINQDGLKEIVADVFSSHNGASGSGYNNNGTETTDGDLYSIVINENGEEVFTKILGADSSGENVYGDAAGSNGRGYHNFVDMDGDGNVEIVSLVGHDPIYYQGTSQIKIADNFGNKIYQTAVGHNAFYGRSYIIADLDKDGDKEIVLNASQLNKFLVYDHELNLLASLDNSDYFPMFASDIDGDGKKEIIAKNANKLYALSIDGDTLNEKWSLSLDSDIEDAFVSDINLDKKADLIVSTKNKVYRFTMTDEETSKDLPFVENVKASVAETDKNSNTASIHITASLSNYTNSKVLSDGKEIALDSGDTSDGFITLRSGKHTLKICATNSEGETCSNEITVIISKNVEQTSYKKFLLEGKSRALTTDGSHIIYATYTGDIYSLNLTTKLSIFLHSINDEVGALSYIENNLYYYSSTASGSITKVNIGNGNKEKIINIAFPDGIDFYNDKIYSVTDDASGILTVFNSTGDKLTTLETGIDDMVGITHTDKFLYVLAENGSIYQIKSETGNAIKIFTNDNLFANSENGIYGLEGITIVHNKIYVSYINDESIYLIDVDLSQYE